MTVIERERVREVEFDEFDELLDVLVRARARVERGWCQGSYKRPSGEVCAVGGILYATDDERLAEDAEMSLSDELGLVSVPVWNDEVGRTKEDVLALYDRVIQKRQS